MIYLFLFNITGWLFLFLVILFIGVVALTISIGKKNYEKEMELKEIESHNNQLYKTISFQDSFLKQIEKSKTILNQIASSSDMQKVITRYNNKENEIELRGNINNRPLRLFWNYSSTYTNGGIPQASPINLHIKCDNKFGRLLKLEKGKSLEEIYMPDISSNWKNMDDINISSDNHMIIQEKQDTKAENISLLSKLDSKLVQNIVQIIEQVPLCKISHTDLLYVHFEKDFHHLDDPQKKITDTLKTCISLADAIDGRSE